jgi:fructose-1,6-bisphosphatase/inositol monophosphatase family enzyme
MEDSHAMTPPFSIEHLEHVDAIVSAAAAREIMPRFRRLSAAQVRSKSSAFDVVTEADEAAERAISAALLAHFPGAVVIGEEAVARDPGLLATIPDAPLAFIVDPLDGTKNFASGLPLFGVMVAVVVADTVVGAVIHDPISTSSALARAGSGAWMRESDGSQVPLRVAAPAPVGEMEGVIGTNFLPEPMRRTVNANLSRLSMTNWFRCSAHEYRLAAAGHCHVLFYNKLMPWDHAAGWLLVRESGGHGAHFDGSPYRPSHTTGGLLFAPDAESWARVRAALLAP